MRNPEGRDFRLRSGVAAIDAGRMIEGISEAFQGKAPDLGAYESGGERWTAGYRAKK